MIVPQPSLIGQHGSSPMLIYRAECNESPVGLSPDRRPVIPTGHCSRHLAGSGQPRSLSETPRRRDRDLNPMEPGGDRG